MNASEKLRRDRLVYYAEDIDQINRTVEKLLELSAAKYVLVVDTEGHMITKRGTTPEAIDEPADAPVCTMLFSRIVLPPSTRSTAMDTTAAGIAEAMVMPANRPR